MDDASLGGQCSDGHSLAAAASPDTPWCSLDRAITHAPPGSRVAVRGGDYPEVTVSRAPRTGMVTLAPHENETVSVAGARLRDTAWVRLEGLRFTDGVSIEGSHHIEIAEGVVRDGGIWAGPGVHHLVIEGNTISSATGSGVVLSSVPGREVISEVTIRANRFDGIGGDAIQAKNFANVVIDGNEFTNVVRHHPSVHPDVIQTLFENRNLVVRNNFIHDSAAQGLAGSATNMVIENNLLVHMSGSYQGMIISHGASNVRFVNNTIDKHVTIDDATGVTLANNFLRSLDTTANARFTYEDYNVVDRGNFVRSRKGNTHDILGRWPVFRDPARNDYRLTPVTIGVDAADSALSPSRDRLEGPRFDVPDVPNTGTGPAPFVDIGAHEAVE